jgi:RNA 2',3'-cyclic 3'-phosphodiesterase
VRLFTAIDIDDRARAAIGAQQARLVAVLGAERRNALKWVLPEHQHVTLAFIGAIDDERVPALVRAFCDGLAIAPFSLALGGLGIFPLRGVPRVLWLGVTDGAAAAGAVQQQVVRRLRALDVPLDDRDYHPHLTLARWRRAAADDRRGVASVGGVDNVARVRVESVTLYESRLAPSGPTYRDLAHARLRTG